MRAQDDQLDEQSERWLSKLDLKSSRLACTLIRFVYLLCGLLGIAMLAENYLHLDMLQQSMSILLIATQNFMVRWMCLYDKKDLPSVSTIYSNKYMDALLIYHLYTIFGFRWNDIVFKALLFLTVLVYINDIRKKQPSSQSKAYLIFKGSIITIIGTVLLLQPNILLIAFQIWCFGMVYENIQKLLKHIKVSMFETAANYITINMPICAYFIFIADALVSKQIHGGLVKIYTTVSFFLFVVSTYYKEKLIFHYCKTPDHLYRCSNTTFDRYGKTKRRNNIQLDLSDCVLCHKQSANVWFQLCNCLAYCTTCYQQVKKKQIKGCPICQKHTIGLSIVQLETEQLKGCYEKQVKQKLNINEYLIKRELAW